MSHPTSSLTIRHEPSGHDLRSPLNPLSPDSSTMISCLSNHRFLPLFLGDLSCPPAQYDQDRAFSEVGEGPSSRQTSSMADSIACKAAVLAGETERRCRRAFRGISFLRQGPKKASLTSVQTSRSSVVRIPNPLPSLPSARCFTSRNAWASSFLPRPFVSTLKYRSFLSTTIW